MNKIILNSEIQLPWIVDEVALLMMKYAKRLNSKNGFAAICTGINITLTLKKSVVSSIFIGKREYWIKLAIKYWFTNKEKKWLFFYQVIFTTMQEEK